MKKRTVIAVTFVLLSTLALSAYSKDAVVAENTLLYVRDHAGENFLVLKVEACSLENDGELHCAMEPQPQAQTLQAGPTGSFFARLAYPGQ
jgi:hypothetical protein